MKNKLISLRFADYSGPETAGEVLGLLLTRYGNEIRSGRPGLLHGLKD